MNYYPFTAISRSTEMPLDPAIATIADGVAMVSLLVNGVSFATPATGAATDQFVGFTVLQTSASPQTPTTTVKVEELLIPGSGNIVISKTLLSGSAFVYDRATGAPITIVSATGSTINVAVANAGLTARVSYRYTLSVAEARSLVGDVQPGGFSGTTYGTVGLAQTGVLYTNFFNSGVDFAAATSLKMDAGGRVTDQSGSGATIPAVVRRLPTVDVPYLGLEFNAV